MTSGSAPNQVQVKVCGLTREDEASACAEAGAGAIGLVFYERSPRFVSDPQAKLICSVLPESVVPVGVFVDHSYDEILRRVEFCGLRAAQLHGRESPELVDDLERAGVSVVKALFFNKEPDFGAVSLYRPHSFLAECAGGQLPGGNALAWDWGAARELAKAGPLLVAGGLSPDNVYQALLSAQPDGVDVSSGVEKEPGRKDLDKVSRFLQTVSRYRPAEPIRYPF